MRCLLVFVFAFQGAVFGQALRDINYQYLYATNPPFVFKFTTVRSEGQWISYYRLQLIDSTLSSANYSVDFETRKTLFEKEGVSVQPGQIQADGSRPHSGRVSLNLTEQPVILVARVIDNGARRAWYYYTVLEPKYPQVFGARHGSEILLDNFAPLGTELSFSADRRVIASRYEKFFPAAPLPFAEKLGAVSQGMAVDSTFSVGPGESVIFEQPGLYLMQYDTMQAEGLAFRIEDDYPRYGKIANLADPMIYICTKQEYDRMKLAKGDKRAFDRVVLSIARDPERAKKLMRSYFRRVEMANTYFTSYKEGWKTDRGMIYIVFGPPDQVLRFNDREVWSYENADFAVTFDFAKSPSLFDPDNYVLLRHKKYTQIWYEVIDLWRNGRF